jgi:hypothetical protein
VSNPHGEIAPPRPSSAFPESGQFGPAGYGQLAPIPIVGMPQPPPVEPGERRRDLIAAVLVAIVVAAAGLGVGVLWLRLAPRLGIIKVADGFLYADAEPEEAIAADGVFGFLGVAAGVVVALLAWVLLRRYRGVAVLIGLVVGSLVGAWLAWWLGVRLGMAQFEAVRVSAPIGARVEAPLALRLTDLDRQAYWPPKVTGVVAAQALVAAATYTVLAGFSIHPGLRPPRRRQDAPGGLSLGPAVPADPTS